MILKSPLFFLNIFIHNIRKAQKNNNKYVRRKKNLTRKKPSNTFDRSFKYVFVTTKKFKKKETVKYL